MGGARGVYFSRSVTLELCLKFPKSLLGVVDLGLAVSQLLHCLFGQRRIVVRFRELRCQRFNQLDTEC